MAVALRKSCFLCGKVSLTNASQTQMVFQRFASASASFKFSDLELKLAKPSQLRPKPDVNQLQFGKHFSDHMLEIEWHAGRGWGKPVINPVHNLNLHPASKVLHYAIELFEGLKAYRGVDGKIRLFRGDKNMERMIRSADRSGLPLFDGGELLNLIKKLIHIDQEWVPHSESSSLYLRPTMIATEPTLGVCPSNSALLFVLAGPSGAYFATGRKPVSLLADPQFVRAWPKGCGDRKMGSNYAPSIRVQQIAEEKGLQQVLWLYGDDHELTEVGSMNIMVYLINEDGEKELITPPLDGLILPGVTRMSLLDLGREWKEFKVTERRITMKEVVKLVNEKRLLEIFGCGTACVVCPVSTIYYYGEHIHIPTDDHPQPLYLRFLKELTDIQYGRVKHPWAVEVD